MFKRILSVFLLFVFKTAYAQVQLPIATNIQKAYYTNTRSLNGIPGKSYWQNKADYNIKVSFEPVTREMNGTVGIDYFNNSPDTLKYMVFKLYPNLYQKGSTRTQPVAMEDLTDGIKIRRISIDHQLLDSNKHSIRGTNMYVHGPRVLPHQQIHFDLTYSYTLNKGSFIRT